MIERIRSLLFENQDLKYQAFQTKLIPNINPDVIIGVRNPITKNIAKTIIKDGKENIYFKFIPYKYYEENNICAYLISECKDYDMTVDMLNRFLPYVDNWATCDIIKPKIFKKHKEELLSEIKRWMESENIYSIRFAVNMLMSYYLDEDFKPIYLEWPLNIKEDDYYINMVIAWYYATALAKQYDSAIKIIEDNKLSKWVHNKTIQKSIESFRVTIEHKNHLKTLKR